MSVVVSKRFDTTCVDIVSSAIVEVVGHEADDILVEVSGSPALLEAVVLDHRKFGLIVRDRDREHSSASIGGVVMSATGDGGVHVANVVNSTVNVSYGGVRATSTDQDGVPQERLRIKLYVPEGVDISLTLNGIGFGHIHGVKGKLSLTTDNMSGFEVDEFSGEKLEIVSSGQSSVTCYDGTSVDRLEVSAAGQAVVAYRGDARFANAHVGGIAAVEMPSVTGEVSHKLTGIGRFSGPAGS